MFGVATLGLGLALGAGQTAQAMEIAATTLLNEIDAPSVFKFSSYETAQNAALRMASDGYNIAIYQGSDGYWYVKATKPA
jgi:hypothetical protein